MMSGTKEKFCISVVLQSICIAWIIAHSQYLRAGFVQDPPRGVEVLHLRIIPIISKEFTSRVQHNSNNLGRVLQCSTAFWGCGQACPHSVAEVRTSAILLSCYCACSQANPSINLVQDLLITSGLQRRLVTVRFTVCTRFLFFFGGSGAADFSSSSIVYVLFPVVRLFLPFAFRQN